MTVVLDTSVFIDVLRGLPAALKYVEALEGVPAASEVTRVEVIRGLRSAERIQTERLFQEVRWVALDEAIARRAGDLGRTWRRSHPGLSIADLVVAATAEEHGAPVTTHNVRHFPMFKGLRAPYRA